MELLLSCWTPFCSDLQSYSWPFFTLLYPPRTQNRLLSPLTRLLPTTPQEPERSVSYLLRFSRPQSFLALSARSALPSSNSDSALTSYRHFAPLVPVDIEWLTPRVGFCTPLQKLWREWGKLIPSVFISHPSVGMYS